MAQSTNWDDLKTTLALIRHGTLAGAAEELGVTYTTVARRISRLEQALGESLFVRLADGYKPTELAHLVAEQAQTMHQAENTLLRQLKGRDEKLSGPLIVTAPQLLITYFLLPVFREFKSLYPEIDLIIRATNNVLDLTRHEADLAFRISRNPGDTLKGIRVSEQKNTWFAPLDVVQALKTNPETLLDVITYVDYPTLPDGLRMRYPNARIQYTMDDMIAIHGAAKEGLGAARMPLFLGNQTPELAPLPLLNPQPYMDVWLIAHPDIWASAKVTAMREIALKNFKTRKALFTGG